uniref:Protein hook n=1 Tax=Wuchereria bancrofti TaxID=6293 RepID=A0AAF5PXI5_WUCBA
MNEYLDDLIKWMNSLNNGKEITLVDVFSGRTIAEALYKIDPLFFNDNWLNKISCYDQMTNWRLKANNLRKIYRRLWEYYTDQLGAEMTQEWHIDTSRIAECDDSELLCRLLQLVLGVALFCANSENFIRLLLDQSESVRWTAMNVMNEIKKILPERSKEKMKASETSSPEPIESKEQMVDLKSMVESLEQECTHLNEKLKEARTEKEALSSDNESLRLRVDELSEGSIEIESLRKQIRSLRSVRESTQDALYKIEAERDHFKNVNLQLLDENTELRTKIQDMAPLEEEFKRLKDELEEHRLIAQNYKTLESQITTYKAKLKEYKAQKIEIKVLEDKVATYMKSIIALEDEQRKNGALKTQIESLQLENSELEEKLNDEIRRSDKAEFDCKQLNERIDEIEKEKEHLRQERRELNEQLLLRDNSNGAPSLYDETTNENSTAVLRERIIRLEAEKEYLLAGDMADDEKLGLKEELNSLTVQKRNLETELKLAHNKSDDLRKRLKELNAIIESGNFVNSGRLTEEQTAKERMIIQIAQLEARLEQATRDLEQQIAEKKTLNEELTLSKQQAKNEKDRLTHYMEKARRMIEDLEEQNRAVEGGALSRHEFDSIRRERDTYKQNIEALKESHERSRTMQEEEQRLFTTHAYYMMMQLQQQNSSFKEHSDEKSFLTRQRQCSNFNIMSLLAAVLCLMLALTFFSRNSPSLYSEVSFTGVPPT